jgi:hypothetical protein
LCLSSCTVTQSLHQGGTGLQGHGPFFPKQSDGKNVWLSAQTELRNGKRKSDRHGTRNFLRPAGSLYRINDISTSRLAWILTVVMCVLSGLAFAQDTLIAVPPLTAPVTDLSATLNADQPATLNGELRAFEERKGSQVAVLIVPTTRPQPIEQYAIRVAEQWKLGRKKVDDGAILVVAKEDVPLVLA